MTIFRECTPWGHKAPAHTYRQLMKIVYPVAVHSLENSIAGNPGIPLMIGLSVYRNPQPLAELGIHVWPKPVDLMAETVP